MGEKLKFENFVAAYFIKKEDSQINNSR